VESNEIASKRFLLRIIKRNLKTYIFKETKQVLIIDVKTKVQCNFQRQYLNYLMYSIHYLMYLKDLFSSFRCEINPVTQCYLKLQN